jgi:DNA-binding response OmpR family regulator
MLEKRPCGAPSATGCVEPEAELDTAIRDTGPEKRRERVVHVLLVDDDRDVCDLLQGYLLQEGFAITCAYGGCDARRVLNHTVVDLALIDVVMPGESGFSVADFAEGKGVAVILMTGHPETITRLDELAYRKVNKPFRLAALSDAIKAALDGR